MKIIKKKENKRETRLMKNIEKYKDVVLQNLNNCHLEKSLRELYGETVVCCPHTKCDECEKRLREWLLEEAKEPILYDAEREYLSAVIKPFKKKVMDVVKIQYSGGRQSVRIRVSYGNCAVLPFFKNNTMYKGMEVGKYYTPEELGL